jgi:hypothetical protein
MSFRKIGDAINYVLDYLSPIEKMSVSMVSSYLTRKALTIHRPHIEFKKVLSNTWSDEFNILFEHRAVISGSFLLKYLTSAAWEADDIDVYMTQSDFDKLASTPFFSSYSRRPAQYINEVTGLMDVYNYINESTEPTEPTKPTKVQIIVIKKAKTKNDLFKFIRNFDLSFCRNAYDGGRIYIYSLTVVLHKCARLNIANYIKQCYITKEVVATRVNIDSHYVFKESDGTEDSRKRFVQYGNMFDRSVSTTNFKSTLKYNYVALHNEDLEFAIERWQERVIKYCNRGFFINETYEGLRCDTSKQMFNMINKRCTDGASDVDESDNDSSADSTPAYIHNHDIRTTTLFLIVWAQLKYYKEMSVHYGVTYAEYRSDVGNHSTQASTITTPLMRAVNPIINIDSTTRYETIRGPIEPITFLFMQCLPFKSIGETLILEPIHVNFENLNELYIQDGIKIDVTGLYFKTTYESACKIEPVYADESSIESDEESYEY